MTKKTIIFFMFVITLALFPLSNANASYYIDLTLDKKNKTYEIGDKFTLHGKIKEAFRDEQISKNRIVTIEIIDPNENLVYTDTIHQDYQYDFLYSDSFNCLDPLGVYTIFVYYGTQVAEHNLRGGQFSSQIELKLIKSPTQNCESKPDIPIYLPPFLSNIHIDKLPFLSNIQIGFVAFGIFIFIMIISGCIRYRDQFQYIRRRVRAKMVFKTIVFLGLFAFGLYEPLFSSVVGLLFTLIGLSILLSTRFVKPIQRQV